MDDLVRLDQALADRHRTESGIGFGGVAPVYLATDIWRDRNAAVKVLRTAGRSNRAAGHFK
ncbi:hypothetical protein ACFL3Z_02180 [Gemmatimonadota bacterium]